MGKNSESEQLLIEQSKSQKLQMHAATLLKMDWDTSCLKGFSLIQQETGEALPTLRFSTVS